MNVYSGSGCADAAVAPDALRVAQAARLVTRLLSVLGLADGGADGLGFADARGAAPPVDTAVPAALFDEFASAVAAAAGAEHAAAFAALGCAPGQLKVRPPLCRPPLNPPHAGAQSCQLCSAVEAPFPRPLQRIAMITKQQFALRLIRDSTGTPGFLSSAACVRRRRCGQPA